MNDPHHFSGHLNSDLRFNSYYSPYALENFENFVSSVSNDQSFLNTVENVVEKSWNMFNNNGYIHNYAKYNIDKEDFMTAFSQTEQIIHSYKMLSHS